MDYTVLQNFPENAPEKEDWIGYTNKALTAIHSGGGRDNLACAAVIRHAQLHHPRIYTDLLTKGWTQPSNIIPCHRGPRQPAGPGQNPHPRTGYYTQGIVYTAAQVKAADKSVADIPRFRTLLRHLVYMWDRQQPPARLARELRQELTRDECTMHYDGQTAESVLSNIACLARWYEGRAREPYPFVWTELVQNFSDAIQEQIRID